MNTKYFKIAIGIVTAFSLTAFIACRGEEPELGAPLSSGDIGFTYTESASTPNILNFTCNSSNVIAQWDFGNGTSAEGTSVSGIYPAAGTYKVKLTVFAKGGRAETTQDVKIENDDPSLLANPLYTLLTGGVNNPNGKVWVIDSAVQAHFGVGPSAISAAGEYPEWYAAGPNEKAGSGMYNDRYVFKINGFKFDMITKGDVYVNSEHASTFPGAVQSPVADYIAPYPNQIDKSWSITETADDTIITVSGGSFIGYYTGVNTYSVIRFTENVLFMRQLDTKNDDLTWYIRLIRAGFENTGGGGNPALSILPVDFEGDAPTIDTLAGSTANIIANPDSRGINMSQNVLESYPGGTPTSGFAIDLEAKLNFDTDSVLALKIWTPNFGDSLMIRMEDESNSSISIVKKVPIPVAFTWVEVSIPFTSADSDLYDRLIMYPGRNRFVGMIPYYIDDIVQK